MKIKTNQKALILLIIMFIGFLFTLFSKNSTIVLILQSGFEAGVVGGFSDWFAVVALFRHPLGIPIPHTALLPKNRQRITTGLVSIVENNLLNKSSIINKVHEFQVIKKLLNICKRSIYSNKGRAGIKYISKSLINHISITKLSSYILNLVEKYLNTIDSKDLLEKLITICLKNNYEEKLLDNLLVKCEEIVKQEKVKNQFGDIIFTSIKKIKMSGIMQHTLNTIISLLGKDKVGKVSQELVILILNDLKNTNNTSRIMMLELMQSNIKSISSNERIIQKIDEYKRNLSDNMELNSYILKALEEIKVTILDYINDDVYIDSKVLPMLNNLIEGILEDSELVNKLEIHIQDYVSEYIGTNHKKIGKLVKDNIEKLDTESLIELIEDRVGDDLQWIRVNGAICGFLVGIVLGIIRVI